MTSRHIRRNSSSHKSLTNRLAVARSVLSFSSMADITDAESLRLCNNPDLESRAAWRAWGPYLPDRQWSTVREDYSADGDAWGYLGHRDSHARAYRFGEDGLIGFCDDQARVCIAPVMWNGKDSVLKERLFGLTGPQGNHGEAVKELYYYTDSLPSHAYNSASYLYPIDKFPYSKLVEMSSQRSLKDPEVTLMETGCFNNGYFHVEAEYAKIDADNLLVKYTYKNKSPNEAELHTLPSLWFRNTWTWGGKHGAYSEGKKPVVRAVEGYGSMIGYAYASVEHEDFDDMLLIVSPLELYEGGTGEPMILEDDQCELWFTENETNAKAVFGHEGNDNKYSKDAFHRRLIHGQNDATNPENRGTKVAAYSKVKIPPGGKLVFRMQLRPVDPEKKEDDAMQTPPVTAAAADQIFETRKHEADEFYAPRILTDDEDLQLVQRQAYAGLLWTKKFFCYFVEDWLVGDKNMPPPPKERWNNRNATWTHMYASDVLSMPDAWEYPWFAAWDSAFHCTAFNNIDNEFSKSQLLLFLSDRYLHPDGQIPAYEWNFSDCNPPVHAWGVLRAFKSAPIRKNRDFAFLKSSFHSLLMNWQSWVAKRDFNNDSLYAGGFLGLDNIGVFDRSAPLPDGQKLQQADGTAWMSFFASCMFQIAMELAQHDPVYEEMAGRFFMAFTSIADALNKSQLWDEEDGFYYDVIVTPSGKKYPMKLRSLVGLVPLFACTTISKQALDSMPSLKARIEWIVENRPDLAENVTLMSHCSKTLKRLERPFLQESDDESETLDNSTQYLLAIPTRDRLRRVLEHMLDENKFLGKYGIRSMSKEYEDPHPFQFKQGDFTHEVRYLPAESDLTMFGGNSSWRGPVWLPMNYMIVQALDRYYQFYGDSFKLDYPTGSGKQMTLKQISNNIAKRLASIFTNDEDGSGRPAHGSMKDFHRRNNLPVLYYEYFNPETGAGLGASHQTGWTALVANLIMKISTDGLVDDDE